ncbi:MAG: hypothetical protein AAB492_04975 [Patescibacteria group bacterium]
MFWFITKFILISIVALTSTYGAGVMIDKAIPKPTPIQYPFYDPTPFPSPTSKPTPVNTPITSQVKGAQATRKILVNCVGPDGVLMTDKTQAECDAFNKAWSTVESSPQNSKSNNSVRYDVPQQPFVDTTISCNIYYPCTGNSYTYKLDSDYCLKSQQAALNMCNTLGTKTPNPTFAPFTPPTFVADPWPTLGASIPIQNNCETFTTNGGSTTVCK